MKAILDPKLTGLLVLAWTAGTMLSAAPLPTQSVTLNPGWNAIYLEIDPVVGIPGVVFTNLPVASVWSRIEPLSQATFVQNQNEVQPNAPGWLAWFPPNKPESIVASLSAIQANHSYLVKLEGNGPVTLTVTGRPIFRAPVWRADAYNLKGFALDPAAPPSFQNYFRHSPPHYNTNTGQLRGVYRLNALGVWTAVAGTDPMKSGEACWVFTQGASDYNGPLDLQVDPGDGLEFGSSVDHLAFTLRNRTANPLTASIRDTLNPATTPLSVQRFDLVAGFVYDPLPVPLAVATAVAETKPVIFGIRRLDFAPPNYDSVVEVKDGVGGRFLIPVTADRLAISTAIPMQGQQPASINTNALAYAGLWSGTVTIKAVSEVNGGTLTTNPVSQQITRAEGSTNPTPVKAEFSFRVLIHVDNTGQARLLKEVVQMFQNGSYTNNPQGNQVMSVPGHYVLLTDDRLISQFQGAALRDGVPVGRRLSTAAIDFKLGPTNHLNLAGTFAIGSQVSTAITVAPNDPTNPFRHKFHPDHDNLDVRFTSYQAEAYEVVRKISLSFSASDPFGGSFPGYGYSIMGGTYTENLTGLHKAPIYVQGLFRLERISEVAVLNQ